eukprot:gnl/TRDRNA2_/TRDRNA2_168643_c0_seq2.p1 gnl/TRDRNA2_/TRDRNA2_168643_c0~~gnl/TRDRNA2_/TRDRNA2_168643_c0_seq2.p1  ORF type:complete len:179 (+),score=6.14 gnl/TRDRNA2_/TRDRNA2_168643_c0_seq2:399-935(+)
MENDCRNSQHFDLTTFLPDVDLTHYHDTQKRRDTEQVRFNWTWRRATFLSSMCLPDTEMRLERLLLYDRMFGHPEHPTLKPPWSVLFQKLGNDIKEVLLSTSVYPVILIFKIGPNLVRKHIFGRNDVDPEGDLRGWQASLVDSVQALRNEIHRRKTNAAAGGEAFSIIKGFTGYGYLE